jgi:hypothetical protein
MSVWRYVREILLYLSGSDADSGKWGILPLAEVIFYWDDPRFIIHREHSASGQIDALAFIPPMQKIRMGSKNKLQRSFLLFYMDFLETIPLLFYNLLTYCNSHLLLYLFLGPVLRIRDVYTGSRIRIFPLRIPDPDPHQRI